MKRQMKKRIIIEQYGSKEGDKMTEAKKAIGVFDSGLGGISVLKELVKQMPNEKYLYFGDSAFAPYGEKKRDEIRERCISICDNFVKKGVKAIVIACNTATSACVNVLRKRYPDIPIVGMEPALKPAVDQKSKQHVIVMATPFTLREEKFENLMSRYESEHQIDKLPTPQLVKIVEGGKLHDDALVLETLHSYFAPYDLKSVDSIVLGCTHFVFYRDKIREIVGDDITIIDGNYGTCKHLQDLLRQKDALQLTPGNHEVIIENSSDDERYIELSKELFHS